MTKRHEIVAMPMDKKINQPPKAKKLMTCPNCKDMLVQLTPWTTSDEALIAREQKVADAVAAKSWAPIESNSQSIGEPLVPYDDPDQPHVSSSVSFLTGYESGDADGEEGAEESDAGTIHYDEDQ